MLQNDFLMRAIRRLAQAFGEFIAGKAAENPQASLLQIENLLAESLNTRRQFLFDELAAKSDIEPRLAVEYGRLLALHANLAVQAGNQDLAALSSLQAAGFLKRGLVHQATESTLEAELRLVEFLRSDAGHVLPPQTVQESLKQLFRFSIATGRTAKAEDYFFMAVDGEADDTFRAEAIRAFENARARLNSQVELAEDELSLDELDALLAELRISD